MKKRINKIWSVGLTLALLGSLLAFAAPVPVAAAAGNQQWAGQPLPGATNNVLVVGSDVTDIAVASDGNTVYVTVGPTAVVATQGVYISTNAGQGFTLLASYAGAAPLNVDVAPDDPTVVVVNDGTTVWGSTNSGTTWADLAAGGTLFVGTATGGVPQDVCVGPARANTLLGRDYAVALANPAAGVAGGNVEILGTTATWTTVAAVLATHDYMAIDTTPNFVGDRCLVTVGALNGATAGVDFQIINSAPPTAIVRTVSFVPAAGITTGDLGVAGTGIVTADIALPADFDPTTGSGRRAYVCTGTATAATSDDVYRIDDTEFRDLDAAGTGGAQIKSLSFSGTIDEGTLVVGYNAATTVKFTSNPQSSIPTWTSCKKNPSGPAAAAATVIRLAADFNTTKRVFAGTTGLQSAFSISNNGAVSFDAEAMIDNGVANTIVAINDIQLTPDGKYLFVANDDGVNISLWKTSVAPTSTSWSRVFSAVKVSALVPSSLVRLNPGWEDSPSIYFFDLVAGGGGTIWYSSNGGDIFATRTTPALGGNIADVAIEDASIVYIGDTAGSVTKSTTSAWTWATPKSAKCNAIISLDSGKADHLLCGGTARVSWSTDGGTSFSYQPGNAGETYFVVADENYDDNNTFFAGDTSLTSSQVYRYTIGEDSTLVGLGNPCAVFGVDPLVGLAIANGALYAMSDATTAPAINAVLGVPAASGVDRNLYPMADPGTVAAVWDTPSVGLNSVVAPPAAIAGFTVGTGSNVLFAFDTATPALYAYDDVFATTTPELQAPADGSSVSIDPVSGRADPVNMVWTAVGMGSGGGNRVDIGIKKAEDPWIPAPVVNNNAVSSTGPSYQLFSVAAGGPYNLNANTNYDWRVRYDRAVNGDFVRTKWSASFQIKVQGGTVVQQPHAGPVILSPQGGATTGLTPGISWAPYSGATKYQIILATDAEMKNRVAGTPAFVTSPAWQAAAPLEYGTTYFFAIAAVEPTVSPQSVGSFTTMDKPVAPPAPAPPVVVKEQPAPPAPVINIPPTQQISPPFIWAIVIIGAILIIAVIVLIVRTRRPM